MSDTEITTGGVRTTSVSITLNGKSLGVDCFLKFEETHEFLEPVDDATALIKRQEIAEVLTEQALLQVKSTAEQVQKFVAENPRGHVSVHQVTPQAAPVGAAAGTVASGPVPAQVAQVANGATPAASGWMTAPDRFDAAKTVRFLSSSVYSTDQLKADVFAWLAGKGLNPQCFEVWDERTGPRGAEAGAPISSVANIKIAEPFRDQVPADVTFTNNGGVKAVARAKFNNDGSLYVWLDKNAEAAMKYGALAALSTAPAAPVENPFA